MAYTFQGFFAIGEETLLDSALERWPFCKGRVITHPFKGIGISCTLTQNEVIEVKTSFPTWSQQFPTIAFVWIEVECWGGLCDYCGFVCRNGETILFEDWPDNMEASENALKRLLSYLGVENTIFPPFQRGYFDTETF